MQRPDVGRRAWRLAALGAGVGCALAGACPGPAAALDLAAGSTAAVSPESLRTPESVIAKRRGLRSIAEILLLDGVQALAGRKRKRVTEDVNGSVNMINVRAEMCRRNFYFFLKEFVGITIKEPMVWNWHIEYICDTLQSWGERIIARDPVKKDYLCINVPPGQQKAQSQVSIFLYGFGLMIQR